MRSSWVCVQGNTSGHQHQDTRRLGSAQLSEFGVCVCDGRISATQWTLRLSVMFAWSAEQIFAELLPALLLTDGEKPAHWLVLGSLTWLSSFGSLSIWKCTFLMILSIKHWNVIWPINVEVFYSAVLCYKLITLSQLPAGYQLELSGVKLWRPEACACRIRTVPHLLLVWVQTNNRRGVCRPAAKSWSENSNTWHGRLCFSSHFTC